MSAIEGWSATHSARTAVQLRALFCRSVPKVDAAAKARETLGSRNSSVIFVSGFQPDQLST